MRDFCHALLLPHRVYLAPILFIIPFVILEFVLKKKGLYLLNIAVSLSVLYKAVWRYPHRINAYWFFGILLAVNLGWYCLLQMFCYKNHDGKI